MFLIFIECLFAIDYTIGTHHIIDRATKELSMAALGYETVVMSKRSNIWKKPSEDPTITFANKNKSFKIIFGDKSKLCTKGNKKVDLCPAAMPVPKNGDEWRLVVGGKGTSIRHKRDCLKIKEKDAKKKNQGLILVPCKNNNFTYFDVKSNSDPGQKKWNPFSGSWNPFGSVPDDFNY